MKYTEYMMCTEKYGLVRKNVYIWARLFKEGWNSIQDESRSTIKTPEMVGYSINV